MAVESCLLKVLGLLSIAGLEALKPALQAFQTQARAQLLVIQTQLLKYDILEQKMDAAQALANAAVEPLESQLNAFPTNVVRYVASCTQLGEIVTAPSQILSNLRSIANRTTYQARQFASFSEELGTVQQELEHLIDLLGSTVEAIERIIIEKTSPPVA